MSLATAPRFGSVRHKHHPIVRRPSFRDDMNLVAVRYEKTSRGEAPIQVTTVNPIRAPSRPTSSASSATSHPSLIVVCPPFGSIPPPTEEHPALREGPVLPRTTTIDEWKRDSGHGATASSSSTPTINEEEFEDDPHTLSTFDKKFKLASAVEEQSIIQEDIMDDTASRQSSTRAADTSDQTQSLGPATVVSAEIRSADDQDTNLHSRPSSPNSIDPEDEWPSPPLSEIAFVQKSPSKRLMKSFSIRSVSSILHSGSWLEKRHDQENPDGQVAGVGGVSISGSQVVPMPLDQALERGTVAPGASATPVGTEVRRNHTELSDSGTSPGSTADSVQGRGTSSNSGGSNTSRPSFWKLVHVPFPSKSESQPRNINDNDTVFSPLSVSLPSEGLLDDDFLASLSFSKRGSVMLGGQRALHLDAATMDNQPSQSPSHHPDGQPTQPNPSFVNANDGTSFATNTTSAVTPLSESAQRSGESVASNETPETGYVTPDAVPLAQPEPNLPHHPQQQQNQTQLTENDATSQTQQQTLSSPPDILVMAADVDRESQKVRSLYSVGDAIRWEDGARPSLGERPHSIIEEVPAEEDELDPSPAHLTPSAGTQKSADSSSLRPSSSQRRELEVAGGFEDYDDLDGAVVDRYGFITAPPRPATSRSRLGTPTQLKSAQFSPRRRNVLQKRDPSGASTTLGGQRPPSRKVSARSLNTQHSGLSTTSFRSHRSVVRQAGNLLPHNRDRRWMDEAGDMLTVSPSLQDIAEEARVEKISEALKRKEWERSEKWRKMAKNIKKGAQGEGMEFEFDVKNPKLIERTWKGVPDRWRSAAWWSFLNSSAQNHPGSPKTEDIIAEFHRLQEHSSPDDVQIDLDVPRTISRHIMFRRRYRGGQRLLFRVLHALSIYFPETGYVQGMASLAATLLCYFDEEKCFVMLVRMWQLRGLNRLYCHGFEGLMTGLQEFESSWLNKDVANKLAELCIDSTAYGTRWYLTLFNLSIPFSAQLRVWDIFMLLGSNPEEAAAAAKPQPKKQVASSAPVPTGLDVLHATSAALIQALREVLLDSDFENAMKTITSFIEIKDEDLLMKVTKAEWKAHQGRKKA